MSSSNADIRYEILLRCFFKDVQGHDNKAAESDSRCVKKYILRRKGEVID